MEAKIFSGDESVAFWHAVHASSSASLLYDYGIKAQEIEAENTRLREALVEVRFEYSLVNRLKIIEAALNPKKPEKKGK